MRVLAIGECMAELAPSETEGDLRLGFAGDTFNKRLLSTAGLTINLFR